MALTRVYGNLISSGTITGNLFELGTFTGDRIAVGTITNNLIASGAITGNKIASNTITSNEIGNGVVFANNISDFTIASEKLANTINLVSVSSNHFAFGARSGNVTVNVAQSNFFSVNTTANTTWTFTGAPDSTKAVGFILELTSGGTYVQSWPASVKWPGGSAPSLTSGVNSVDVLVFITDNGGTIWRGSLAQANSA